MALCGMPWVNLFRDSASVIGTKCERLSKNSHHFKKRFQYSMVLLDTLTKQLNVISLTQLFIKSAQSKQMLP